MAVLDVAGSEVTFTDTTVTPGWLRLWYRAVAWSIDDLQLGLIGARSPASAAVSVLLPPSSLPDLRDLRVNEPGSTATECLISWASSAPLPVTPLGPHTAIVEVHDPAGNVVAHFEGGLDSLLFFSNRASLPAVDPAKRVSRLASLQADVFGSYYVNGHNLSAIGGNLL